MTVRRSRSLLPHFLAALYGLAIFYASLQPFSPWIAPAPGTPFFLFARWPPRWVRYDVLTNVLAYVPFGFLVALAQGRQRPLGKFTIAIIVGALMSFSMETLQMFEPTRDASVADVLSNTAGVSQCSHAGVRNSIAAAMPLMSTAAPTTKSTAPPA